MKLNFFLLLFLNGMVPVTVSNLRTVPHKYDLVLTPMTWYAAGTTCRMNYTNLAIILSDTDRLRLKKEAASAGLTAFAWVGAYRELLSWQWSLNNVLLSDAKYSNWGSIEPNGGLYEACVGINVDGTWFDVRCTALYPFICYNAKFSGAAKFISISTPLKTWFDAQTYCQTNHTDLASSLNSSDNSMLWALSAKLGPSWFGLRKDIWKWPDGTFASGLSWTPGEPDNYQLTEGCAVFNKGLYNDVSCNNLYSSFCHTDFPTRRQTVRLSVKSDGSVLDPAVQSSILEQIKQKLKEKGIMEYTTVTWAVPPDGNIFHKKKKDVL